MLLSGNISHWKLIKRANKYQEHNLLEYSGQNIIHRQFMNVQYILLLHFVSSITFLFLFFYLYNFISGKIFIFPFFIVFPNVSRILINVERLAICVDEENLKLKGPRTIRKWPTGYCIFLMVSFSKFSTTIASE